MPKVPIGGDKKATASDIPSILATIRHFESGNNYGAKSKSSTASGAYQIIDSTWNTWKKSVPAATGYAHAYQAPAAIQDQVAGIQVANYINQYGWLSAVPIHWYLPSAWDNPTIANQVPAAGGNTMTVSAYAQRWVNWFNTGTNASSAAALPPPMGSGGGGSSASGAPPELGFDTTSIPAPPDPTGSGRPYMVGNMYVVQRTTGLYYYVEPDGLIYIVVAGAKVPVTVPGENTGNGVGGSFPDFGIGSVVDFLRKLADPSTWIRVAKVLAGIMAVVTGLVLLGKQMGVGIPSPIKAAAAVA